MNNSDTARLDFLCDPLHPRKVDFDKGLACVYQDLQPTNPTQANWQAMTFLFYSTAREAIDAAMLEVSIQERAKGVKAALAECIMKDCEQAFQNGGPKIYSYDPERDCIRPFNGKSVVRALELALPGHTIWARRKGIKKYFWKNCGTAK